MDDIGREYLLIALSLGELEDGIVDSYYGPAEIRDEASTRGADAETLAGEARLLRGRVNEEVSDGQRQRWLDRQLVAIETTATRVAGAEIPYPDEIVRCFDAQPEATPRETYVDVRERLDELLPGNGSLRERLDARDERLTIPSERLSSILDWLVTEIRRLSGEVWPAPQGESVTISLVTGQPWSAYNWYDGGLQSRIEVNTDLPTRAHQLVGTLAHETFPGHHLEHAWKEQRLVREGGHAEASVLLVNTPDAYISEGLAELGPRLLVDAERWQALLIEICARAGFAISAQDAEREKQITETLRTLRGSGGDAALQLHVEGRSRDEVREFLVEAALASPERAEKSLEFITHPLWRTYVFCYAGGDRLLTRWCEAAGDLPAQRERFFRLLTEQLTPSGIAEETAAQ